MFTKPEKNILQFGLTDGMRVADLGCGNGFYTRVAGEIVGYSGKVYAIDIQKEVIKKLEGDIDFWKLKYTIVIFENNIEVEHSFCNKKQMHDFAFSLMKQGYKHILN